MTTDWYANSGPDPWMSEAANLKHWPPCMIVDIPTSWRRKQEQLCLCVGHMSELYNSGYTELFTVWGEETFVRVKWTICCMWVQIGSTWRIRWNDHCGIVMQTVATITATLVTCSCVVIGAIAEYAELSVHDNYPLRNLGSGTASIRPKLTTPEFCRTTTFCLTPSVVPVVHCACKVIIEYLSVIKVLQHKYAICVEY